MNVLRRFISQLGHKEMRIAWIFFVLSAGIFGGLFLILPPLILSALGGFLAISVGLVFFLITRSLRSDMRGDFESAELHQIITHLSDGIIIYDSDFTILRFNTAAEEIFSLSSAVIVGKRITPEQARDSQLRLLAQIVFPSLASSITPIKEESEATIVDIGTTDPIGQFRVTTAAIPGGGFLKIIHDRSREAEITRSKSEFVAIVAHNLRTPLNGLKWAFEILKNDTSLSEENKKIIPEGTRATERMLAIVNDLLTLSRIEDGKYKHTSSSVELGELLAGLVDDFSLSIRQIGLRLEFKKPDVPIVIQGDAGELKIALSNVIDNAVKYNVEQGAITIDVDRIEKNGGFAARIRVRDTGIGIPPDQIDSLFTKFFRAKNVAEFQTEGTGLGLYIAKNIIDSHHGTTHVESELNRGTTVIIEFPIAQA